MRKSLAAYDLPRSPAYVVLKGVTMTTSDVAKLTARLVQLERQQRSRSRLALGALCLGVVAFVGRGAGPVIRAEQVEIITANGTRRAALNADSTGVTLTLFSARGHPASAVRLSDSTLTLLNASGQTVATLGGPRVRHLE